MYIDDHVHCRDEEQSDKETIAHALEVAEHSGLSAIFDMPNTQNPVTNRKRVIERMELAKRANSPVFFGVHIGITEEDSQIEEAVKTYNEFFPRTSEYSTGVIGLKMFAGKSGDLTIAEQDKQLEVYEALADLNYEGVLVVHCEKESEMREYLWNPLNPISHCDDRPEKSEIESVRDQIKFAGTSGYEGHLHIPHISVPESVDLVQEAKLKGLRISCGATPHHLLLDNRVMDNENGIFCKVNPPLRKPETRERLFRYFKDGKIDTLESDHAPHTMKDKLKKHMSGIPGLASWPDFITLLKSNGVSQEFLDKVAFENVNRIFGTQIKRLDLPVEQGKHLGDYVFDAYVGLK